jgi:hypothetical protein
MTIHSASDHGYTQDPPRREVRIGDMFRSRCALGVVEYEVMRPMFRQVGWYECVHRKWITPVEEFRQGMVGSHQYFTREDIVAAKYAP